MEAEEPAANAAQAFQAGHLEEAYRLYSEALDYDPASTSALCNRSLVALRLGRPEQALEDAGDALHLLQQPQMESQPSAQLAKAFHRKAQALMALGQLLAGIKVYKNGLAVCRGAPELHAALRVAAERLPPAWLAKYWARVIEAAQAPNPLSSRDGSGLKPVPPEHRLATDGLETWLEEALAEGLAEEARDLMCETWAQARRPSRASMALFRAAAYLQAGNPQQALKDARFALVYGPIVEEASGTAMTEAGPSTPAAASAAPAVPAVRAVKEVSCWPAALALQSAVLEALADNVPAAISMARACQLDPEHGQYQEALARLLRRIPEQYASILQAGGPAALEGHLAEEHEEAKPEFLRQRPKYYYYYQWMRKRITGQYPELPEPVMDKLLTMEANELDLVLQYPRATHQTVERLVGVYNEQGGQYLETYPIPLLSWEDMQVAKEEAALGLPAPPPSTAAQRALPAPPAAAALAEAGGGSRQAEAVQPPGVAAPAPCPSGPAPQEGQGERDDGLSEAGSIDVDELFALD